MERPSDYYRRLSEGSTFVSQEEHYRKQYQKSSIDLEHLEDELGMLEAVLIDEPEYDIELESGDLYGQILPFGERWWEDNLQIIQSVNPSLKDIDVRKALLEILRRNGYNIQEELVELLGTDLFDLISELIENREKIIEAPKSAAKEAANGKKSSKKGEKKRKEVSLEEALRMVYISGQADSMQYPFVFTSASVRSVDVSGKSVALPTGTEHENTMEYESFEIPYHRRSLQRAMEYPLVDIQLF
jgi:N-terminal helicase PWI domain